MARAIDRAGIQFRTLNASKGPAVRATRAQADRELYRARHPAPLFEASASLSGLRSSPSTTSIVEGDRVAGVVTDDGRRSAAGPSC